MTARHLCISDKLKKIYHHYTATDLNGTTIKLEIHKIDDLYDICVLKSLKEKFGEPIVLSPTLPEIGDSILNLSAPSGYFGQKYLGIFDGRYCGQYFNENQNISVYCVFVAKGSSGSPVLNTNGQLIGIITGHSSIESLKQDIAVGVPYEKIREVIQGL